MKLYPFEGGRKENKPKFKQSSSKSLHNKSRIISKVGIAASYYEHISINIRMWNANEWNDYESQANEFKWRRLEIISKYKITHTHTQSHKYIFTHTSEHTTEIPTIQSLFIARVEKRCPATSSKSHAPPPLINMSTPRLFQAPSQPRAIRIYYNCLHSKYYLKGWQWPHF